MKAYIKIKLFAIMFVTGIFLLNIASCKKGESSSSASLKETIQEAQALIGTVTEGTSLGMNIPGSKAILQNKIDWANSIFTKPYDTIDQTSHAIMDNAATVLKASIETFKSSKVVAGSPKFVNGSFFDLGNVDDLIPNKSAFSIEVKAKLSDLNTDHTTNLGSFITVDDKSKGILLRYTNTGKIEAYIHDGAYKGASSANVLTLNTWHHITFTFDGKTINLYLDGIKVATRTQATSTVAIIAAGSPVRLGMARSNEWNAADRRSMHGNLKDVRFWNYALTETEVNANKAKALTGTENGLIAFWPFDVNLGNSVADKTGKFTAIGTEISYE